MSEKIKAVSCIILLALIITGCATTSADRKAPVVVSADGVITVGGKAAKVSQIASRLTSMGFREDSSIIISVQMNTSNSMMSEISSNLASAGFFKAIFIRPKQATSFKGPGRR